MPFIIATSPRVAPEFCGCGDSDSERFFRSDVTHTDAQLSGQYGSAAIKVNVAKGLEKVMSTTRELMDLGIVFVLNSGYLTIRLDSGPYMERRHLGGYLGDARPDC